VKAYVIVACDGEYSGKSWGPVLVFADEAAAKVTLGAANALTRDFAEEAQQAWAANRAIGWYGARNGLILKYGALAAALGLGDILADDYEMHEVEYRP
jgi:hypothetical protein